MVSYWVAEMAATMADQMVDARAAKTAGQTVNYGVGMRAALKAELMVGSRAVNFLWDLNWAHWKEIHWWLGQEKARGLASQLASRLALMRLKA